MNQLIAWRVSDGALLWQQQASAGSTGGPLGSVWAVAFSPDGLTLASGAHDGTIRLWDPATGGLLLGPIAAHGKDVFSLAFSPDNLTLWSGGGEDETHAFGGRIRLWSLLDGAMRLELTEDADWVRSVAISSDGGTLLSGSVGMQYAFGILTGVPKIRIWDTEAGQLTETYDQERHH